MTVLMTPPSFVFRDENPPPRPDMPAPAMPPTSMRPHRIAQCDRGPRARGVRLEKISGTIDLATDNGIVHMHRRTERRQQCNRAPESCGRARSG